MCFPDLQAMAGFLGWSGGGNVELNGTNSFAVAMLLVTLNIKGGHDLHQ